MANTIGLNEATMLQIVDSTSLLNLYASRPHQLGCGGPLVVRISDHADNDAAEVGSDTDKMAIFTSKQFGHPWVKEHGAQHLISEANAALTGATVIFPNYDYSTLE